MLIPCVKYLHNVKKWNIFPYVISSIIIETTDLLTEGFPFCCIIKTYELGLVQQEI